MRRVTDTLTKDLKSLEFEHTPKGPLGIGISMKLKPSAAAPDCLPSRAARADQSRAASASQFFGIQSGHAFTRRRHGTDG
jgi:hypothetical protein